MKDGTSPTIGAVLYPDTPTVRFNETTANRQSQPDATTVPLPPSIDLVETVEDPLSEMRGDPRPCIRNSQGEAAIGPTLLIEGLNLDGCIGSSIPPCVFSRR